MVVFCFVLGAHQNSTASPHMHQERDTNVFDEESIGRVPGAQPFWLHHGAGRECAPASHEYALIAFESNSGFQLDTRIAVAPQPVTLVSRFTRVTGQPIATGSSLAVGLTSPDSSASTCIDLSACRYLKQTAKKCSLWGWCLYTCSE